MTKWKWIIPALCCVVPLKASQVFHMSLDEVFGLAETVFLARVESVEHTAFEWLVRADFELSVTEVLLGPDSLPGTRMAAFCTMDLPRVYIDSSGDEIWESPVVFGSGIEMSVSAGDTVVVLAWRAVDGQPVQIVRLEPADSLGSVRDRLGPDTQ